MSPMQQPSSVAVQRIHVKELFGRYTYSIETYGHSHVMILYGENGSGKTTILSLLFHLLSTSRTRGHRTAIGRIPFCVYEVTLKDGSTVYAMRDKPSSGNFTYGVTRADGPILSVEISFDEDGDIIDSSRTTTALDRILSSIENAIGTDIYYIGDDRSVVSDRITKHNRHRDLRRHRSYFVMDPVVTYKRYLPHRGGDQRADDLLITLAEATEWARRQVIGATSIGTASANTIYADVIKRIAQSPMESKTTQPLPDELADKIVELEERNKDYEPFGLASGFAGHDLNQIISKAGPESWRLIQELLQPYLESIEARLDAVSSLQSKLSNFVSWMNRFLKDKNVTLRLPQGIEIFTDDGQLLPPEFLSSGEQHLLLLLASTLYAQERPSLFIIDEPELSLNMKWQRQLLNALTECTSGGSTQFILATHSFEILASHQEQVNELISSAGSEGDLAVLLRKD